MGISIVVPMGVFFTQVLMTVMALVLLLTGLALLSLAMRRNRLQIVPVTTINHQPSGQNLLAVDRMFRSIFAMQTALPSRAPPIPSLLRLRANLQLPPAGGAGGVPFARLTGTRSAHVRKLPFA